MSPRARKPDGRPVRAFNTETGLRRRPGGTRAERRSLLILCEGKTEKQYFTGMRTGRGPQLAVVAVASTEVVYEFDLVRGRGVVT